MDVLGDAAYLIQHRPWGSKLAIVGDFNADQLPALSADPFAGRPGREAHHREERFRIQSFADKFQLEVEIPQVVWSTPGGPFDEACAFAPVSLIPEGHLTETCLPSSLDYALA